MRLLQSDNLNYLIFCQVYSPESLNLDLKFNSIHPLNQTLKMVLDYKSCKQFV